MEVRDSYYEMISPEERNCYDQMYSAILSRTNCTMSGVNAEDVGNAYKAIAFDHPEILYHPGLLQRLQLMGNTVNVVIGYSEPNQDEFDRELNEIIQVLYNRISRAESDYERYKIIYDYLTEDVEYNFDVLNEYMRVLKSSNDRGHSGRQMTSADSEIAQTIASFINENSDNFTPYGIIVNKKGVCMGIAKTYKILCDSFGLPCICVQAVDKRQGVEHL